MKNMKSSEIKQRKKTSDGQKKRSEEKDEDDAMKNSSQKSSDHVKLVLSLMSLCVSLVMMWVLHQQNSRFAEMKEQYDDLYDKSQRVLHLGSQMSALSQKLQASIDEYDGIQSSITLMTKLKHNITSIHHTSLSLQEHQEMSSVQYQTMNARFQSITETCQSRLTAATHDLGVLKTNSRSAHGRVTAHVNDADGRLRVLYERLQELEDGIKRNTRVLDRTEEEDAGRVQEMLDWNSRRLSELQERLRPLAHLRDELQTKLEKTVPGIQQWESRLPAVEESIRSMLKVRAQLSETQRRLRELMLQVNTTEEKMFKTLAEISSQDTDSHATDPRVTQEHETLDDRLELRGE